MRAWKDDLRPNMPKGYGANDRGVAKKVAQGQTFSWVKGKKVWEEDPHPEPSSNRHDSAWQHIHLDPDVLLRILICWMLLVKKDPTVPVLKAGKRRHTFHPEVFFNAFFRDLDRAHEILKHVHDFDQSELLRSLPIGSNYRHLKKLVENERAKYLGLEARRRAVRPSQNGSGTLPQPGSPGG